MRINTLFTSLALLLVLILAVPGVSAATVSLDNGEIAAVGGETTVYLVLDSAPEGLSGYNIDLTLSNPSVAEITNVTFPEWAAGMNAHSQYPGTSRTLVKASDVNNKFGNNGTNQVLAFVTVRGLEPGSTGISLSSPNFDNEAGTDYTPVTLKHSVISINTTSGKLPYNAQLTRHTIPTILPKNRNVTVALSVNNSGIRPWTHSAPGMSGVYLAAVNGSTGDAAKFGFTRMDLPENSAILNGREYTFGFTLHVPNETGNYMPAYQLLSDSVGPFGPVFSIPVTVTEGIPAIRFTSPADDNFAGENVTFGGTVSDATISTLNIRLNNANLAPVPVTSGNFSGTVILNTGDVLVASAVGKYGFTEEARAVFDGDRLTGDYEQSIGFDPQNADSDNIQTAANEAGNGIPDGYEKLDGRLPVFVKYRLGAKVTNPDTDGDGLTDEFELIRLGLTTNVTMADSDSNGVSDADENPDQDGLTNIQEQAYGSDPLIEDSDGDLVKDITEVQRGTNPSLADTDADGLDDDSEARLGTNPLVADSNGNGVSDGNETFTSTRQFFGSSLELSVTGTGDAAKRASVANVNYTHLIPDTVLVSNVSAVTFGNQTQSAVVRIHYFPAKAGTPSNLSVYVKNETSGSFDSVSSTVEAGNKLVYATVAASGEYCVMDKNLWNARFKSGAPAGQQMALTAPAEKSYAVFVAQTETSSKARTSGKSIRSDKTSLNQGSFIDAPPVNKTTAKKPQNLTMYVYGKDYGPSLISVSENTQRDTLKKNQQSGKTDAYHTTKNNATTTALSSSPDIRALSGSTPVYEMVYNGDFSNGLDGWVPGLRDQHTMAQDNPMWDIQTLSGYDQYGGRNYYSSSPGLSMYVAWKPIRPSDYAFGYVVKHIDVDTSYADKLTFRYRCSEAYRANEISSIRLYWGYINKYNGEKVDVGWTYSDMPTISNQWSSGEIDLAAAGLKGHGMQTFFFEPRIVRKDPNLAATSWSATTFHIDDVSVLSTEPSGAPTTALARFRMIDAETGQVLGGFVDVQKGDGTTAHLVVPNNAQYTPWETFTVMSPSAFSYVAYPSTKYGSKPGELHLISSDKKDEDVIFGAAPPTPGSVSVSTYPEGASIYINDQYNGVAPITISGLTPGSFTVKATKSGYRDATENVLVKTGITTPVTINLVAKTGSLDISSTPAAASVFIDGINTGKTTPVVLSNLAPGSHTVVISKTDYSDYSGSFTIADAQTTTLAITLNPKDSNNNGIPDPVERSGYVNQHGKTYQNDPASPSPEGVGSAILMLTKDGNAIWKVTLEDLKIDTDHDGASDYTETVLFGTDPWTAPAELAPELIAKQTINLHTTTSTSRPTRRWAGHSVRPASKTAR